VATVLLPRSLLALFPGVDRRHEIAGDSVAAVIEALDATVPGLRDRLVESGPRLRPHINIFVDGSPAELMSPVPPDAVIHVIPAISGGETADPGPVVLPLLRPSAGATVARDSHLRPDANRGSSRQAERLLR
jgi:molybdopterin synthase sulfur carrier subunit